MVNPGADHTDQLLTDVNCLRRSTLIIPPIPLLRAAFHLCRIVGRQGESLEATTSSYGTSRDEVVQGERIKGPESTPWTLHGLIDGFGGGINAVRIVTGGPHVLDVVPRLELLALGADPKLPGGSMVSSSRVLKQSARHSPTGPIGVPFTNYFSICPVRTPRVRLGIFCNTPIDYPHQYPVGTF